MSELTFGIRLTADGKQLVGEIKAAREEFDKLSASAPRAAQQSKSYWADQQAAANASTAAWLKGNAATDAAADKAWALANGYKEAGGQIVKAGTESAKSMTGLGLNTQFARREMMLLGKEALTGDFGRMPRTFGTLVTHSNLLQAAITPIGLAVSGVTLAVAAGGYAWYQWGKDAEEAVLKADQALEKAKKAADAAQRQTQEEHLQSLKYKIQSAELSARYDAGIAADTSKPNKIRFLAAETAGEGRRLAAGLRRQADELEAQIAKREEALAKKEGEQGDRTLRDSERAIAREKERYNDLTAAAGAHIAVMGAESAAGDKLTASQQKLVELRSNYKVGLTAQNEAAQRAYVASLAQAAAMEMEVVGKNAAIKAGKELADARDEANKAMQRSALEAQQIIFDIDPIAKASAEWEKLNALKEQGLLTDKQAGEAYAKSFEKIDKAGNASFKSLEDAVRGYGKEFTNTFVNSARNGKLEFRSLADSIISDLLRIQAQKNLTDPLVKAGTSFLDGFFKGSSASSASAGADLISQQALSASLGIPFANGGIMTSAGRMPLNAYSGGGIANSPQLAIFGEGRMPEAYVPLPDGRSIPVNLRGSGTSNAPPNLILNISNQSGQAVNAKQQGGPQFDGRDWVLGVVLEAADSNPSFRNAMGMGR